MWYQANTIGVWKYFIHINIIYIQHYISETYQASTLGILPMFHIFGIGVVTMHTLAVGGKMTTLPGFDPQTFLATLEITKVLNWNEWNLLRDLDWEKQQVGNTDFLTWLFYPPYGLVPMSVWKVP